MIDTLILWTPDPPDGEEDDGSVPLTNAEMLAIVKLVDNLYEEGSDAWVQE
jgi:hypothetical protein